MKFVWTASLLIHSAAAFARPSGFWGRSSSGTVAGVATAAENPTTSNNQRLQNTCLHATPAVDSKPAVIDAANWELLSPRGQAALARLVQADEGIGAQSHVYSDWPAAGTEDEGKKRLAEQVCYLKTTPLQVCLLN